VLRLPAHATGEPRAVLVPQVPLLDPWLRLRRDKR